MPKLFVAGRIPASSSVRSLYDAMASADLAFSAALHSTYGKRAGDVRYVAAEQTPEIQELGAAFRAAADAWRTASKGGK